MLRATALKYSAGSGPDKSMTSNAYQVSVDAPLYYSSIF